MDKDISTLFMNGLSAAQSSTELFLSDAKVNIFSNLKKEFQFLILSSVSFLLILVSAVYLLLFGVSRALDYFKVDLLYHSPLYATAALFLGLAYYAYSSHRQTIRKKVSRSENIKTIATFKHDISELVKLVGEIPKWISKYKTFFVMVIAASIFIKGILIKPKADPGPMLRKDEKVVGIDDNSIRDAIKGLVISILFSIIGDLIEKIMSKPPSSTSPQSNKSC